MSRAATCPEDSQAIWGAGCRKPTQDLAVSQVEPPANTSVLYFQASPCLVPKMK